MIAVQADVYGCVELQQASVVFSFPAATPDQVVFGIGAGAVLAMHLLKTGHFHRSVGYRGKIKMDFVAYRQPDELEPLLRELLPVQYDATLTQRVVTKEEFAKATNILE